MRKHPEQKPSELFLGNFITSDYEQCGWKTKRLGNIAYFSADGTEIKSEAYSGYSLKPAFVERSEVEAEGVPITEFMETPLPDLES